jgi:predicted small secreted protein
MSLVSRKSFLALVGAAVLSPFVVGCETVEGVGEDIEELGDEIEDEANDAQRRR